MKTTDATPLISFDNELAAKSAQVRLAAIELDLRRLDEERDSLIERRGDALGAVELGTAGAQKRADALGLQLAESDAKRSDLAAMATAITAGLSRWNTTLLQRKGEAAAAQMAELAIEAREAEQRYAEQMIALATTSKQLRGLFKRMQKLRSVIYAGGLGEDHTLLARQPGGLMPAFEREPERHMDLWLRVKAPVHYPPTPDYRYIGEVGDQNAS